MPHDDDPPLAGRRAGVMIGPLFEDVEATYPYHRLREAGAEVVLVGIDAGEPVEGKRGQELVPDRAARDLAAGDLDLLVVAGGYGPDKLRMDEGVLALVRGMHEAGRPVAFICHAAWVPVSAGILAGRRCTSYASVADDCRNAGAEWVDAEVVVDGTLVSSRGPDDLPAFVRAAIEAVAGVPATA